MLFALRFAITVVLMVSASGGAHGATVTLTDPRYDDRGAGGYIYPTGPFYRRGDFDLRSLEVWEEDGIVTFRVSLDYPIIEPNRVYLNDVQAIEFTNHIYLQNIDIYVDTTPGTGEVECVPGRNVRFADSEAWDTALVLTPQPFLVSQAIRKWRSYGKTIVAHNVRSRGVQAWVEVPASAIGGPPQDHWGYQVVVSGHFLQANFEALDRAIGSYNVNALTIPVFGVAEEWAFGGGELSRFQPRSIDILVPEGRDQYAILKRYSHEQKEYAAIPMIYPHGGEMERIAREAAARSATITPSVEPEPEGPQVIHVETRIRDVQAELAILERAEREIPQYKVGVVEGDKGEILGRVVITGIYPTFLQATIVEGLGKVEPGAIVKFDWHKE